MRLPWSCCPREPSPEQTLGAPGAGSQVPRRLSAPWVVVEKSVSEVGARLNWGERRGEVGFSPLTWTMGAGHWGMVPAAEPHAALSPWASVVGWESELTGVI